MAISTVSDPSGSGRVDMLTGPVAAARAWVKSKHDMYLIVEVWELKLYFYPSAGGLKKKKCSGGRVADLRPSAASEQQSRCPGPDRRVTKRRCGKTLTHRIPQAGQHAVRYD